MLDEELQTSQQRFKFLYPSRKIQFCVNQHYRNPSLQQDAQFCNFIYKTPFSTINNKHDNTTLEIISASAI